MTETADARHRAEGLVCACVLWLLKRSPSSSDLSLLSSLIYVRMTNKSTKKRILVAAYTVTLMILSARLIPLASLDIDPCFELNHCQPLQFATSSSEFHTRVGRATCCLS